MTGKITIFLLLFFVFSFLFRTDSSFDQDLGRHIKLGEIIVQTHQVPTTNLFSYTNPDFPFINTHWLFEVFVYLWSTSLGLQSLLIFKIIIFLLSVWLIFKIVPKDRRVLLLPIGFIFLHVLRERLELRPEIFSFLFTASTYYILETYTSSLRAPKGRGNLIFLLPLIQLIWVNTHIYFFVGLTLQAIFLIHLLFERTGAKLVHPPGGLRWHLLLITLSLSILLSFLNPNGLSGILYPLNVTKNYGYTIVENQTMFLLENIGFRDPNFLFVKLSATIIAIAFFVTFIKKRVDLKNILVPLTGLGLALLNVRSFPYLVFLSLPAVLQNLGPLKRNLVTSLLFLVFSFMLLLESYFYLNGDYYRFSDQLVQPKLVLLESGKKAMDFVLAKDLPQPIFNNFDIGSYILYRGYPKYKVFVDGRPEAYPAQFFTGIYIPGQSDYANFKQLEELYKFKTIIFSHTDQTPWAKTFLQSVVKDPDWKIVYIDNFMIILVREEVANQKQLPAIDLSKLNPSTYQFDNHLSYLRLGIFLLSTDRGMTQQNTESGKQFIQKALQLFPNDPIANSFYGQTSKNPFFW